MKVVIVESPAKAKTINKYLGSDYKVLASFGHIRDLPSKDGSVKPDDNFSMTWEIDNKSEKQVKEIASAVKNSEKLILATDPDREGEAIAWHLLEELKKRKVIDKIEVERVVFNEITKNAILNAMKNPRQIDSELVNAYLARRALDYLVGFTLSPVLWRKLPGCKSAGRVQSVALRLICEREDEIDNFKKQEYWTVDADLITSKQANLVSRLTYLDGKKLEKFDIPDEKSASVAVAKIKSENFKISRIARKKVSRNPAPPFTTSTLQQEAARKLYFSAKKTMQVAQKLYEGVDVGGEVLGLITYMRTDGVQISNEAIATARELIQKEFGKNYLPTNPRFYKNKVKNAQEAHEAIRPTDVLKKPEYVSKYLDKDQKNLYELIWKRTVASQMENAEFDQLVVDSSSRDNLIVLRSTGQVMAFDGFCRLYSETDDDEKEEGEKILPKVEEGEKLNLGKVSPEQHFTQPPPRYSEASLVKKLEELGIGRPSTYASIISVLQDRDYVKLDKRRFTPEDRGRVVTAFLENYFNKYVQYNFTADLENELDEISSGNLDWHKVLSKFWKDFYNAVQEISPLTITEVIDTMDNVLGNHFFPDYRDGNDPRKCPKCKDGRISIKIGRFGAFIGCSNYPECNYTRPLSLDSGDGENSETPLEENNRLLGKDKQTDLDIFLRKGPYGYYVQLGEITIEKTEKAEKSEKEDKKDKKDKKPKKEKKLKPKRCTLPKGISPDSVTLEKAQQLLSLPRDIGKNPETGEMIQAGIGRFGAYLKYGKNFKSIPAEDNLLEIGLERALEIIKSTTKSSAVVIGNHPEDGSPITLNKGRFGPYIKHGKVNASVPKAMQDEPISIEDAVVLLKAREEKDKNSDKPKKTFKKASKTTPKAKKTTTTKKKKG